MKLFAPALLISFVSSALPAFANVVVTSPQPGSTLGTTVAFVASANSTTCRKGVAAMGVYVDSKLAYSTQGTNLNASLKLGPGKHVATIQSWDFCGGSSKSNVPVTVMVSSVPGVFVTLPVNNSTVALTTSFVATATTTCSAGIAAIGVYVNNVLVSTTPGNKLNKLITLPIGSSQVSVQTWDQCGGTTATPLNLSTAVGSTFSNLQRNKGWKMSGQVAPNYSDCEMSCPGVTFSAQSGIASPSLSGNATQWNLGGTTPYSDVLFYNQLIGTASTQGLPDFNRQIIPLLHHFTYDADFYFTDAAGTQALEFDINMFPGAGVGMTWGTECRIGGGNEWDIWDNVNMHWIPTGLACNPQAASWNHVTLTAERTADNKLLYESITLNGVTTPLNKMYAPFSVPSDWYGVTVNYQMDGNVKQKAITTYVDNLSFRYW